MRVFQTKSIILFSLLGSSEGLISPVGEAPSVSTDTGAIATLAATRRYFFGDVTKSAIAIITSSAVVRQEKALASGGATAGGVYLLSAKQRYNERVTKGIVGFLSLGAALEKEDIGRLRDYFTSEDTGAWKDLMTAGFLLANAFRRNSTAAPDSLPAVKAWKKFAAEVEAMTKALKKKDTAGALACYQRAVAALDDYLEKVELPSVLELSG